MKSDDRHNHNRIYEQLPSSLAPRFDEHLNKALDRYRSNSIILGNAPPGLSQIHTFEELLVSVYDHLEEVANIHAHSVRDLGVDQCDAHDWRYNCAVKAIAYHAQALFPCAISKVRGQASDSIDKIKNRARLEKEKHSKIVRELSQGPPLSPSQIVETLERPKRVIDEWGHL